MLQRDPPGYADYAARVPSVGTRHVVTLRRES
jgi:hypothetical protein